MKKSSIFLAPYNLLQILVESFRVAKALFVESWRIAKDENKEHTGIDVEKAQQDYKGIAQEFESEEFEQKWRVYITYSLVIQISLTVLFAWHLLSGGFIVAFEMLLIVVASVLFFGYRPWIRRNKLLISFVSYIRYGIRQDPSALLLWKSFDLTKKEK